MKYDRPESDEWIQPIRTGYKMSCCDCGLVHELDFRIRKGRVQYRARRNQRSTGQVRRWIKMSSKSEHIAKGLDITQRIAR